MDTIEALKTRRSIRHYKKTEIDDAVLDKVLEAATYAPSGRGLQAPVLVVVKDDEKREQLRKLNLMFYLGNVEDPYFGAPVIVLAFASKDVNTYIEDASCTLTYLMLAAHAEGLGTCWVHREREMFKTKEGKALMKEWGLDDKYEGIGSVSIGYPDCDLTRPAPRKDGYIIKD